MLWNPYQQISSEYVKMNCKNSAWNIIIVQINWAQFSTSFASFLLL